MFSSKLVFNNIFSNLKIEIWIFKLFSNYMLSELYMERNFNIQHIVQYFIWKMCYEWKVFHKSFQQIRNVRSTQINVKLVYYYVLYLRRYNFTWAYLFLFHIWFHICQENIGSEIATSILNRKKSHICREKMWFTVWKWKSMRKIKYRHIYIYSRNCFVKDETG